jgi:glyoxylase-like metal-dependent hydrolase (beta-lactamase superfamily II)/8-oxo-dGTP pyrophosphatase MutT (NUDIX family)
VSELPDGIPPAEPVRPQDSASGVILGRDAAGEWRILLGLRSRRSRFLPAHLACPGGRLETEDGTGNPDAFARCAAREVEEETGVTIPAASWIEAGERTTPPVFPIRFRTRFFVGEIAHGAAIPEHSPSPREIEALRFETPAAFLDDWSAGRIKVPPPTLAILRALDEAGVLPLKELAWRVASANAREERTPRIEFAPGIWMAPLRTATLPPASHTNAWLAGGKRFAIIDPGTGDEAELDRLMAIVARRRELGHVPATVVLTHHHRDHVGGAVKVAQRLGLPVRAHPQVLGVLPAGVGGLALERLADGDELGLDGMTLRALHTPGHAPGHLAFLVVDHGLLIAGDLASGLSTILINPEDGDMGQYLDSLSRVRDLGCRMLLPSHGPPLPGKALDKLVDHRRERERKILEQVQAGQGELPVIARVVYADLPRVPAALTELQTTSHLLLLEREGRVRREDAGGRRWSATTS